MRIASFAADGRRHVGLVTDDLQSITPFVLNEAEAALGALPIIEREAAGLPLPPLAAFVVAIDAVRLLAPLPKPRRNLFCVGRNYRAHAAELKDSVFLDSGAVVDQWPIVFTKVPDCVVGPHADIRLPGAHISEQIDYEAELAVVIGKGGKNIARDAALEHVFGYTIVNDVTARDVQVRHSQWDLGKSFDTFCPMGPWIVTADGFDVVRKRVKCWVNGELRQDGPTSQMIFDIPTLIETISRGITLFPGDVIATGTPAGVGMGLSPPVWLQRGDEIRIEVDGLGALHNRVV
ncbi:fumarylacetoacetate hydrolase family protein [Mitsuaria sp. 7]|uniref:fumarylacetoacetate hydrolase family protein n=1 Tax=Mitsuaria sp. 7 TaxID=1658665 RepID=UPI0007DCCB89|nr:fumarylacetoacetate hydrolase family protein [Mitsuaria sp. 7]ANH68069.1 hydrolase [Mitsuaria sp. 7]